jgi:branched-chain amino acid transport system ATP-binding protein
MALLEVEAIDVHYGAVKALSGVSFHIDAGEIVTLVGSNGAGKTTSLRAVSGLVPASAGRVRYDGADALGQRPDRLLARGLAHAPEGRGIFPALTVRENLMLGAFLRRGAEVEADLDKQLARFPRLKERFAQPAGTLSGGEQQMLAIARALMARPRLLLLDEPSLGLAPQVVHRIFELLAEVNRVDRVALLLVEQNAHLALGLAHRGYVLETGSVLLSGTGRELLASDQVRKAYLGE